MPTSFELISRLMAAAAIALVAVPLVRASSGRAVWLSVGVSALFIFVGVGVGYPYFSNWHWPEGGPVTAEEAVASGDLEPLIAATQASPTDPGAWAALATALLSAQRPVDAVGPLEQVYALTDGSNVEWTLLLVDSLMMTDDTARGRVSDLVESMLVKAPMHPKALYYGAELAFSRNELALARSRWQVLLERAEQEDSAEAMNVRDVLSKRIALVNQRLGDASAPDPVAVAGAGDGPTLTVKVSLAESLLANVGPDAAVFVLARDGPGPPVAVVRRSVRDLPFDAVLTDANAMLPSRKLSNFEQVEVVARVSLSGAPIAQSGDLFGTVNVATSMLEPIAIVIENVQP
ncbi:MAG: tetratricopeptide repeat protein [Gammaproteobacteria bacterium]